MSNKKYITLKIGALNADLPADGIDIQLTYLNSCSEGFGKISGNKSERSFTLPATKQNDDIFDNWWKVAQLNTPTAAEEKNGQIRVNGLQVLTGKAQLKQVTTQGRFYERQGKKYQVAFYGNNADWFEAIRDLEIGRDLDWSTENHTFDGITIEGAYNNAPASKYAYGIIKLKDWANLDSTTPTFRVSLFESTPLLFIGELVEKIFNSIGYVVESGSFFSNPVNERYVMPVILPDKYPQEFSEARLNAAATKSVLTLISGAAPLGLTGVPFDVQTKTPPVGTNPIVLSTPSTAIIGVGNVCQYTAKYAGFYQWTLTATVGNIGGNLDFNFIMYSSGFPPDQDNAVSLTVADNGNTYTFTGVIDLEAGEVMESIAYASAFQLDITAATLDVIGEAYITDGAPIDFTYLLRDWKAGDFIKGLTAAFNLCFETNEGLKRVYINSKDDYLVTNRALATSGAIPGFHFDVTATDDSTPKLDFNKEGRVIAKNEIAEVQQYQWKQDSADKTAEAQNKLENIPFDAARYNMPLGRFKQTTETNENPFFAGTLMHYDESIRAATSELVPLIPLMWPDDYNTNPTAEENTTEFAPRILWFGGQRGGTGEDGFFQVIDSTGIPDDFILPALFFVNYNDTSGLDVSLSWSDKVIQGSTIQGHTRKFYLRDLRRMREGKELEEWLYWDELDMLNLSFRPKIFINNSLFILKKIDSFSPVIDRTTKTILIYDLPPEQEDLNRLENTLSVGLLSDFPNPDK